MKILFIRHGESTDDIDKQHGGWADFHLTSKGKRQIQERIGLIEQLGLEIEKIYTSPLLRAKESAEIISKGLGVEYEVLELVKEQNKYGILSGMKFSEAEKKYPEIYPDSKAGNWLPGAERDDDMAIRVRKSIDYLENKDHETIMVVTHGNYLKILFSTILNKKLLKKQDGGFVLVDFSNDPAEVIAANGIEYS